MTNSPITYHDEDAHRVHDDCVEGDTASEGDTSDEEDIEASRNNSDMRRTSSLKRKEGLELPSGSVDRTGRPRTRRRKIVALAIVAVVATSAAIGGAIYFSTKDSTSLSPSTTIEGEYATSSSIPVSSSSIDETIPSTVEDENDSASDSEAEANGLPKGDSLGLIEEMVDPEETIEKPDKKGEKEGKWPELIGMTGEEAQDQLEVLYGEETYDIIVLPENSATTRDYRFDRIRIFVNEEGIVTKVPHVG